MLKNRVALYNIGFKKLDYNSVWTHLDNKRIIYCKINEEGKTIYVKVIGETMRDIEYYCAGLEWANPKWKIERTTYNN